MAIGAMPELLIMLSAGDLRSEGRAAEVAAKVINDPRLLTELAEGLRSDDRLIRARTCMALEVISRDAPALLEPLSPQLIDLAVHETVPQARWHLAEIFSRLSLTDEDVEGVVPALLEYLADKSKIVRYCAVDALGLVGARSARRSEIIEKVSVMTGLTKSLDRAVAGALRALGEPNDE